MLLLLWGWKGSKQDRHLILLYTYIYLSTHLSTYLPTYSVDDGHLPILLQELEAEILQIGGPEMADKLGAFQHHHHHSSPYPSPPEPYIEHGRDKIDYAVGR